MDYLLPDLRAGLAEQVRQVLAVDQVVVENANPKFGADLAIPVFALAKRLAKSHGDIAAQLAGELKHPLVEKIEAAGGYVNVWLDARQVAQTIIDQAGKRDYGQNHALQNQTILIEHTDPNPFKQLHIGHVYSNTIGEALARLHEAARAKVHRVSYHGDIGPHIAKAIYGIQQLLQTSQTMQDIAKEDRTQFLGKAYSLGAKQYEEDEASKEQIDKLNEQIYEQTDDIKDLYETGKRWSFEYFDSIYQRLATSFEKKYMESETAERGLELVREHTGSVYEESDGAIIFRGEEYGLHTRVFVTKQGLPMYETKDLGLVYAKEDDYPDSTSSIVVTGREQQDYFAVMLKSLEQFAPELAHKTSHIAHGLVRLPTGKMSSRSGEIITAEQLFDSVVAALSTRAADSPAVEANMLAAIKYGFLKQNIGANIVLDIDESVSLEGQTGPYIQYAAVRINSIMNAVAETKAHYADYDWQAERELLMQLARYPETIAEATEDMAPHVVAQYLYQLARSFNRYYEQVSLKATESEGLRGARRELLAAVANALRAGLELLNIPIPEKM